MSETLYQNRLQTEAKHAILSEHLTAYAFKLLQSPHDRNRYLTYVDGFSGPWAARDDINYSDTSFGKAAAILHRAVTKIFGDESHGRVRCIFNEANPRAFAELKAFVERAQSTYPTLEIVALQGRFQDNAVQIGRLAGGRKTLTFVDPKGWCGYPPKSLRALAGPNSEFLINLMTSFTDRFLATDHPDSTRHLCDLLGESRAAQVRAAGNRKEALVAQFREMLRSELGFEYVLDALIWKEDRREAHYRLVFASNHPTGVMVIRNAESTALSSYDEKRHSKRLDPRQPSLFAAADAPSSDSYLSLHQQDMRRLHEELLDRLNVASGPIRLSHLIASVLEELHLSEKVVRRAIANAVKAGELLQIEPPRGAPLISLAAGNSQATGSATAK